MMVDAKMAEQVEDTLIKSNLSVGKAAVIVMFLSGVAILTAFFREMTVAYYFGASAELDSFLVALSIPHFVGESLVVASVIALIPVFAKIRAAEGDLSMMKKISNLAVVNLLGLSVFTAIYVFAAPLIIRAIAPGFEEYRYGLALRLTIFLAPLTILSGSLGVLKAIHNITRRFAYPELGRSLVSLGIVGALVLFTSRYGIWAIAAGFIIGTALAMALNALPLAPLHPSLKLGFNLRAPEIKEYLKILLPVLISSGIYYIHIIVNTVFASTLDAGSVSALRYASTVIMVPITLIGGALGTAIYPAFADLWAQNKKQEFNEIATKAIRITFFLSLPLTAILFTNSEPIIKVLFERGKFTSETSSLCSSLLAISSLNLVSSIGGGIFTRVLFAAGKIYTASFAMAILSISPNVLLNILLTPIYGVQGIVSATVISGAFTLLVYMYVYQKLIQTEKLRMLAPFLRATVVSIIIALIGYGLQFYTPALTPLLRLGIIGGVETLLLLILASIICPTEMKWATRLLPSFKK